MDHFTYRQGQLFAEDVAVTDIVNRFGSPCYIYSRGTLERHWHAFDSALGSHPHQICYAVKANSNIAVLNVLAQLGSGFDIVSGGELTRVLAAGGDTAKVIFSGVGKQPHEIKAALEAGIGCFNVESEPELRVINKVARELGVIAPISLRVNPDVDAKTHPYISTGLKDNKFGIDINDALKTYEQAASLPNLRVTGIDCHIGSQLTSTAPFLAALERVLALVDNLHARGIEIEHLDMGGGLGVRYQDETPPEPAQYCRELLAGLNGRDIAIYLEPGRAIAANAGIFATQVEYLKPTAHKNFAIVDGAMNDLIRPALYSAWQDIIPVVPREEASQCWDIVGPVCETGDFLGKDRMLALETGDFLAIRSAGAYGFTMSSNYNSRNRVAEIMVDGDQAHLIRQRESYEDQLRLEMLLPTSR